jgi:hypothetical protein
MAPASLQYTALEMAASAFTRKGNGATQRALIGDAP